MKWLISAARNQPGSKNTRMKNNLAKELLDAYENEVRLVFCQLAIGGTEVLSSVSSK